MKARILATDEIIDVEKREEQWKETLHYASSVGYSRENGIKRRMRSIKIYGGW